MKRTARQADGKDVARQLQRELARAERQRTLVLRTSVGVAAVAFAAVGLAIVLWATRAPSAEQSQSQTPPPVTAEQAADSPALRTPVAEEETVAATEPEPRQKAESAEPKDEAAGSPERQTAPSEQTVTIGIGATGYEPSTVTVKAGVPVVLTVSQGEGCAAGFLMPELGVSADNSQADAVVKLPPLKPGTYRFTCGMEMVEGRLTVM